MDFSEFETTGGGIWSLAGVVDYAAKVVLACPVTTTQTAMDAVASLEAARLHAEAWLVRPLLAECVDPATGELTPLVVVTDNGPAYKSAAFARYIASRPELAHVRTRYRSPGTNGVIERFFQAVKYEHLYREELQDGAMVGTAVARYLDLYNAVRPYETLGQRTPLTAWRAVDHAPIAKLPTPETASLS
jgi:transposase InsO family protein